MTDRKAPETIDDADLDRAQGGWGKTSYYSHSEGQSASYTSRSSDDPAAKPGRTTYANITLERGDDHG